jgi:hypothetical protein
MELKDRWRTVALVAGSLLAGSLIGPPLVQAATASLVTIQGAKSTNQAKVSSTGELSVNPNLTQTAARQLLATEVAPSSFYQPGMINLPTTPTFAPVATPPSGTALVLTYLHTDIGADPTPGQGNDVIYIIGNAACTARVGTFEWPSILLQMASRTLRCPPAWASRPETPSVLPRGPALWQQAAFPVTRCHPAR